MIDIKKQSIKEQSLKEDRKYDEKHSRKKQICGIKREEPEQKA